MYILFFIFLGKGLILLFCIFSCNSCPFLSRLFFFVVYLWCICLVIIVNKLEVWWQYLPPTLYGIRGIALKLMKSYLTDRTQYVIYDGMQSTTLPISCGVPQGSILGPLLFIITMNDIGNVSEFLYTILYADDTCVLLNGNDYLSLIASLNSELDKLSIWLCANKLSLNVQKTYFMVFHRAKIKIVNPIDVTMNNCCLKKTDSLKYLGVIIDHRLNWSQHITHVKNKVSKGM